MIQKLLILAAGLSVGINAFAYDFEAMVLINLIIQEM